MQDARCFSGNDPDPAQYAGIECLMNGLGQSENKGMPWKKH